MSHSFFTERETPRNSCSVRKYEMAFILDTLFDGTVYVIKKCVDNFIGQVNFAFKTVTYGLYVVTNFFSFKGFYVATAILIGLTLLFGTLGARFLYKRYFVKKKPGRVIKLNDADQDLHQQQDNRPSNPQEAKKVA